MDVDGVLAKGAGVAAPAVCDTVAVEDAATVAGCLVDPIGLVEGNLLGRTQAGVPGVVEAVGAGGAGSAAVFFDVVAFSASAWTGNVLANLATGASRARHAGGRVDWKGTSHKSSIAEAPSASDVLADLAAWAQAAREDSVFR